MFFLLTQAFFTRTHTHTRRDTLSHTHTHAHTFAQSSFTHTHTDTISNRGVLLGNGFTRGAFIHRCFYTGILLHDFRRISRYKCSASRCKTAISPQLVAIETHLVGKGWPAQAHMAIWFNFFGDRHFVRGGCVSWTSIHAACRPKRKLRKLLNL